MRCVRLVVADDHEVFRCGVVHTLSARGELRVVAEVGDGQAAVNAAVLHQPDLVLMDINMPLMDGVEATRRIKQHALATRVVILTVSDTDRNLFEAIKAGADGYLLKSLSAAELHSAVHAAAQGDAPLSPAIAARLLKEMRASPAPRGGAGDARSLTGREAAVLRLAAGGLTYREIAGRLHVAESTVKNHMRHLMEKLQLRNRAEAIHYALNEGLVAPNASPAD